MQLVTNVALSQGEYDTLSRVSYVFTSYETTRLSNPPQASNPWREVHPNAPVSRGVLEWMRETLRDAIRTDELWNTSGDKPTADAQGKSEALAVLVYALARIELTQADMNDHGVE